MSLHFLSIFVNLLPFLLVCVSATPHDYTVVIGDEQQNGVSSQIIALSD